MARLVHCIKLGKDLPGLKYPPLKGELGQRIFDNISDEAWKMWLKQSTMVINEYRINPTDPTSQKVLREQLEKFLFGGGSEPPADYKPPHQHHK